MSLITAENITSVSITNSNENLFELIEELKDEIRDLKILLALRTSDANCAAKRKRQSESSTSESSESSE